MTAPSTFAKTRRKFELPAGFGISGQNRFSERYLQLRFFDKSAFLIQKGTVGLRIRAVCLEKKLTQEKLAETAGVGVTHISHIETGNSIPSLQVAVDIVNALGSSMDELLCMDEEQARSVRDSWLGELVADCSGEEVKLITDTVLALKDSLRRLKLAEQ